MPSRLFPYLPFLTTATLLLAAFPAWSGDVVTVGSVSLAQPGEALVIPLTVRDVSGTLLGGDGGPGRTIQNVALTLGITPVAAVASAELQRAGVATQATPVFETTESAGARRSLVLTFSEAGDPLPLALDGPLEGDLVAELALQVAPGFDAGTIQLQLVGASTALGNHRGTIAETRSNDHLDLVDGSVLVDSSGIFVDGFESGDTGLWQ